MFEEYQNLQIQPVELFPLSVFDVLANMAVALGCGIMIALVYRFIYKGPSYSSTYVNSLVLLSMITSLVIVVIGNNLARAFGLVGAMSIIRFRTAVRDVQDIVFIFFSLACGMAAGVGLHAVAIAGAISISLVIMVLVTFNFGTAARPEYLLQITYRSDPPTENSIKDLLKRFCRRIRMVNVKNQGEKDHMEAFYQLALKRKYTGNDLAKELNQIAEITKVNLYFDQEESNTTL